MYKLLINCILLTLIIGCSEEQPRSDGYGNFESYPTTISAEGNGKLLFLNVKEGEKLIEGQQIAIIDTTQLHLQRLQIKANLNTLPKKLRNSLSEIEVLQDQKKNIIRERDRAKRLIEKKAATPKLLDDLNGQIDVIDKKMQSIRTQMDLNNRAILSEKEPLLAQMSILNEQIKQCYIDNPISGTVITKLAELHEMVRIGTPLYRIASLDTMTLHFYTDALQLQHIDLGQTIEVLVDKTDSSYYHLEGIISWISEQAEFTPKTIQTKEERINLVYAVKADVANPNGIIKIGMPAEVNFNSTEEENE